MNLVNQNEMPGACEITRLDGFCLSQGGASRGADLIIPLIYQDLKIWDKSLGYNRVKMGKIRVFGEVDCLPQCEE